ncbi:MAG: protein-disulfide reductase DsbD domain-containing protein [Pyrinomonadaceae bacterium]
MRRFLKVTIGLTALLGASFLATSAQTVTGTIAKGEITKGRKAKATVVLEIPHDLHTNSNNPGSEYAIPTTVRFINPVMGVRFGAVVYPRGTNKKFEFSEKALNIYEGKVEFTFDVTVPTSYRKPKIEIEVLVRYQACTNEVCYPPTSKKATLVANVR